MHTPCAGFSKHETGIPPGARYQVSGTGYLAPGTRDRINTEGRIPSTEDRARTLGNAPTGFAGNRDRRLPHLRRQAVGFPSGEMRRKRIDPLGQVDGLLPHLQVLMSPHDAPWIPVTRDSSLAPPHVPIPGRRRASPGATGGPGRGRTTAGSPGRRASGSAVPRRWHGP